MNGLLNRGARPDMADNEGTPPLLRWVTYCVAKKNRAMEMAILKKMLSFPNLQNTHSNVICHSKSAYEIAQSHKDQEVLNLLTAAGVTY